MEHFLDVSDMEPPEPMERILEILPSLAAGDYLHIQHRREPHLLYPMLEQQGFTWHTDAQGSARFDIYVWRQDDEAGRPPHIAN